jgi:hypothetical protein
MASDSFRAASVSSLGCFSSKASILPRTRWAFRSERLRSRSSDRPRPDAMIAQGRRGGSHLEQRSLLAALVRDDRVPSSRRPSGKKDLGLHGLAKATTTQYPWIM